MLQILKLKSLILIIQVVLRRNLILPNPILLDYFIGDFINFLPGRYNRVQLRFSLRFAHCFRH